MELPKRKRIRLKNYDYSSNGAYFITICSYNKEHLFGNIVVGQGLCSCRLSNIGEIIKEEILIIPSRYNNIKVDAYVIMPNHIHLIVFIAGSIAQARQEQSPCPTYPSIGDIICALKSITTKRANKNGETLKDKIWQFRFHDHVIRNEKEYQKIWQYIDTNIQTWQNDCFYEEINDKI